MMFYKKSKPKKNLIKFYSSKQFFTNNNGNIQNETITTEYDSSKPKNKGEIIIEKNGKKQKKIIKKLPVFDKLNKFIGNFEIEKKNDIFDIMKDYIQKIKEIKNPKFRKSTEKQLVMKQKYTQKKPKHKKTRKIPRD